MQDTGFGFLWVSLVPSFKFPFLTALAKQGETTQCQHSRHGSQRSPQQRCRRHQHSHLETDPNTPNEVQRREEEKTGGTIHSSVMWLHAERGGAGGGERRWVESYKRQSDTYMFVVHCLKPTQPGRQSKREREKEQETKIMGRGLYGWQPLLNKEKSVTAAHPLHHQSGCTSAFTPELHELTFTHWVCCTADSHLYTHREILKITRYEA